MPRAAAALREHAEVEIFESERMISRDELKAGLRRSDFLYTLGDTPIDGDILDANPDLKGIAAMTKRCRALEMEVLYTKRTRLREDEERALGVQWVGENDEIIRRSDYVCLMVKYTPETHLMFGAREFALMKPTAFFVNTARGRL